MCCSKLLYIFTHTHIPGDFFAPRPEVLDPQEPFHGFYFVLALERRLSSNQVEGDAPYAPQVRLSSKIIIFSVRVCGGTSYGSQPLILLLRREQGRDICNNINYSSI